MLPHWYQTENLVAEHRAMLEQAAKTRRVRRTMRRIRRRETGRPA